MLAGQLAEVFARHDVRDVGFFEDLTARIAPKCVSIKDIESVRAVLQIFFAHETLTIAPPRSFTIASANLTKKFVAELSEQELSLMHETLTKLELDDAGECRSALDAIDAHRGSS